MHQSFLSTVMLPVVLALVMLGLGLSLTVRDFARVAKHPKAVAAALTCQVVVLPLICLGLVTVAGSPPALAVGMMLLAASPGGTVANLYSHLFGGDVALNITLTAVNSVLSVVTLPIVVDLSLRHFMGEGEDIGLQTGKVVQVFAVVLVPVVVGMVVRHRRPGFADTMARPAKIFSAVILVAVVVGAIIQERHTILDSIKAIGLVALLFSLLSLAIGYGVPRLARVEHRQAVASSMEIGIHNGALAITIALSVLNSPEMSIPPAIYAVLAFITSAAFGYALHNVHRRSGHRRMALD